MRCSKIAYRNRIAMALLAMLAMPAFTFADGSIVPVSVPVYAERLPTTYPAMVEDPATGLLVAAPASAASHAEYTALVTNPQPVVTPLPVAAELDKNFGSVAAPCAQTNGAQSCGCEHCASIFDHRTGVFGEYLLLRAFDVDMAHGIQQNGVGGLGTAPAGDVGTAQPGFTSGYRVGAAWSCCCNTDVSVTYTEYATATSNLLLAAPGIGGTAASLVLFPNTVTAASTFDSLFATYSIDFQTFDIDYSTLLCGADYAKVNFLIGARYGHLQQDFQQNGVFAGATGEERTNTNIGFDGVGARAGLDGQWELGASRFAIYARSNLSVLFGNFTSNYSQFDVTTTTLEASSHWVDGRVLPILENQLGLEWTSCSGCCRFSAGYSTFYWFNTVDTAEFIQAVQSQSFTRASQTIAFTGLSARAECRF